MKPLSKKAKMAVGWTVLMTVVGNCHATLMAILCHGLRIPCHATGGKSI
ncbi:hypothetical protein [Polynucleobacter necessarius]|nr:hypothetical protein [Polynucleobacter necessarius]